ncbi:Guanine deaminase [Cricetulus griseus]|uniref:Guanine deaminase n=1 Tax=Cricetulus griseus TaxID=10029 RepID=G3I9T0_CRIGR|nr:Guanine deaminase [Cricetulus griseus]
MCAAQTPPLAHIFRGTFVHSTWTCPMEVLRDHLLGVSDSGKVSGRGVPRTADRWRDPGEVPAFRVRSDTE